MIPPELGRYQSVSMVAHLGGLYDICRRRFRDAALLVGADLHQWPALASPMEGRVDFAPLRAFWSGVCLRYNVDAFDAQAALPLTGETATASDVFSRFIQSKLWPYIASENECVRNVLRAVGALPYANPALAAGELMRFVMDLPLSAEMRRLDPSSLL